MDKTETANVIERCRGTESRNAFARRVGISRRMLGYLYAGERNVGLKTIRCLMAACPAQAKLIAATFVSDAEGAAE